MAMMKISASFPHGMDVPGWRYGDQDENIGYDLLTSSVFSLEWNECYIDAERASVRTCTLAALLTLDSNKQVSIVINTGDEW